MQSSHDPYFPAIIIVGFVMVFLGWLHIPAWFSGHQDPTTSDPTHLLQPPSPAVHRICSSHSANVALALEVTGRRNMALIPHQVLGFDGEDLAKLPFVPISALRGGVTDDVKDAVVKAWNMALDAVYDGFDVDLSQSEAILSHRMSVHLVSQMFTDTASLILYLHTVWPLLLREANEEWIKLQKALRTTNVDGGWSVTRNWKRFVGKGSEESKVEETETEKQSGREREIDMLRLAFQEKLIRGLDNWCQAEGFK